MGGGGGQEAAAGGDEVAEAGVGDEPTVAQREAGERVLAAQMRIGQIEYYYYLGGSPWVGGYIYVSALMRGSS
jgi:hypothetical protein